MSAPKAEPAAEIYKDPSVTHSVAQQAPPLPTEALTANTTDFSYPAPTEAAHSTTPTSTTSSTKPPQILHAPAPTETLPIGEFTGPSPSNPYAITGANVEATNSPDTAATSKPHKTHGVIQKVVGSVQIGVGKLVHNSTLVEKGQEKKIRSGEERVAKKEHNLGGGDHGKTGLRKSMEGDDIAPTGRYSANDVNSYKH
ncbi:hypothetical protein HK097_004843 [Rhizophlyctis rosea]|uniref:Uncharacterized protein n=1 Tax=Rhizophlyctis rosea TaxID=64517 RepID=A0AAD5SF86_9FUNG|nr:hypothetical protein HK097_004843 [Rhizophlyctis rosea]